MIHHHAAPSQGASAGSHHPATQGSQASLIVILKRPCVHGHLSAPDSLYAYKANLLAHRGAHGRGGAGVTDDTLRAALSEPNKTFGGLSHLRHLDQAGVAIQLISPRPYQMMHSERPARLTRVRLALAGLPEGEQRRLGVLADWKDGPHLLTYRQAECTFGLVARALGKDEPDGLPSPRSYRQPRPACHHIGFVRYSLAESVSRRSAHRDSPSPSGWVWRKLGSLALG